MRQYRREANPDKRIMWLKKLAPTHDPRVAVALGDAMTDGNSPGLEYLEAAILIEEVYVPRDWPGRANVLLDAAFKWWDQNKVVLRCRANQLPR